MIQNALSYKWVDSSAATHSVGEGMIKTPHDEIMFSVKVPHEFTSPNPIEVFPGFTDGIYGTDRLTNAYAEAGRLAFTLSHPRKEHPDFINDPEGHKVRSAMLVLSAVRAIFPDLQEVDAQGHSEGGANSSRACLEHPEEFRTLIVMASGGLIEADTQLKIFNRALRNPKMLLRATGQLVSHPSYTMKMARNSADYILKNPPKASREAAKIASADIRARFPVLSKRGIPNGALQFISDALFPLELVRKSTDNGRIFDMYEVYPFGDADHITPQKHPRTVAKHMLSMTDKLVEIQDLRNSEDRVAS